MAIRRGVTGINVSFKKLVAHCIIRTLLASAIAFVLYASFTSISVGMLTKEIGYTVLYSEDGEYYDEVYNHYLADGEDTKIAQYETDERYYKTPIRSSLTQGQKSIVMWLAQALSLIVWFAMIYGIMWSAGDSDANKAELGHAKRDKLKGIKAALAAELPFVLAFLVLVVTKAVGVWSGFLTVYEVLNYYSFAINNLFIPYALDNWGALFGLLLGFLPLPLFAAFGYLMGQKHIIFKEKILYQKEQKNG